MICTLIIFAIKLKFFLFGNGRSVRASETDVQFWFQVKYFLPPSLKNRFVCLGARF